MASKRLSDDIHDSALRVQTLMDDIEELLTELSIPAKGMLENAQDMTRTGSALSQTAVDVTHMGAALFVILGFMFKHQPFGYKREHESFELMQTFWVGLMFLAGAIIFSLNREQRYQARAIDYTGTLFNGIKAHSTSFAESLSAYFGKQPVVEPEQPIIETETHMISEKQIYTYDKAMTALKHLSGTQLAAGYEDGTICIINLSSGKIEKKTHLRHGHIKRLEQLGKTNLAVEYENYRALTFSLEKLLKVDEFPGHVYNYCRILGSINDKLNAFSYYESPYGCRFGVIDSNGQRLTDGLLNDKEIAFKFLLHLPDEDENYIALGDGKIFLMAKKNSSQYGFDNSRDDRMPQTTALAGLSSQNTIIYKKYFLAAGCEDGKVRFWVIDRLVKGYSYKDCADGGKELDCQTTLPIKDIRLLKNGVLLTLTDKEIKFWDIEHKTCLYAREEPNAVVEVLENGEFIIGYGNGKLDFYNGNLPAQDLFVQRPIEHAIAEPQRLAIAI